jgi:hypothetical protein
MTPKRVKTPQEKEKEIGYFCSDFEPQIATIIMSNTLKG